MEKVCFKLIKNKKIQKKIEVKIFLRLYLNYLVQSFGMPDDFAPIDVSKLGLIAQKQSIGPKFCADLYIRHTSDEGMRYGACTGFPLAEWQRLLYVVVHNFGVDVQTRLFGMGGMFYGDQVEISRQTFSHNGFTYRFGFDGKLRLAFILNCVTRMRRFIYDPNEISREFSLNDQVPASCKLTPEEIAAFKYDQ